MEVKLIEIRDRGTFIAAMAVRLAANEGTQDHWLFRRAGYVAEQIAYVCEDQPYVILVKLDGVEAQYDSFAWPNQRTLGNAHRELIASWSKYRSGDVLDVEYVLGEAPVSKVSERGCS